MVRLDCGCSLIPARSACAADSVPATGLSLRSSRAATDLSLDRGRTPGAGSGDKVLALGSLWAPFMTAALVIQVDLSQATVPQFRPPDTRRYWFKPSRPDPYTVSPTWYAPTRHPAELRAALSQQGSGGASFG